METINSSINKLNKREWIKGLVITILSGVVTSLIQLVSNEKGIDINAINFNGIIGVALTAGLSYISITLKQDQNGQLPIIKNIIK
ncbi:MAG: hypothetical protein M0P71_14680 [Melioribacteraceae bacterium]|jgi:hypothetical protein|nr:hypothetical protein [Melioribacteraceae bacterium]